VKPGGAGRAYLLGLAFSLAFCPTLFWLFFGLTVPLALRSAGGWSFPGLLAAGKLDRASEEISPMVEMKRP
jgi:hypothetical protein